MVVDTDAQGEGWYEAIARRHSRRRFTGTRIEEQKLDRLEELIAELNKTAEACRVELVPAHDGRIFSGIRGGYGVIKGAPSCIAFIGIPGQAGSYEQLGYVGQAVVLEATRLELGTCWVSGTFDPAAAERDLKLGPEDQVVAVSPLGYPRDGKAFSEKVMSGLAGSGKRKPLEKMCAGEPLSSWPDWARTAVEAGRLAPSAMNRQPWVFRFESGRLSVETDDGSAGTENRYSKRLDCAIALRHLAVGAQHSLGKPVSVEYCPERDDETDEGDIRGADALQPGRAVRPGGHVGLRVEQRRPLSERQPPLVGRQEVRPGRLRVAGALGTVASR